MKTRLLILMIGVLLWLPGYTSTAQDMPDENPILRLLRFVADTPENRQWVAYGDVAAWHTSWGVPRIQGEEEFNELDRVSQAYWQYIMPDQTGLPRSLGFELPPNFDFHLAYGFDVFMIDRFITAGTPTEGITVVESDFNESQISQTLLENGYELNELGTRYSIDQSTRLSNRLIPRVGKLGLLNHIALLDSQLVIARSEENVTTALTAYQGETVSLADNLAYVSAVNALDDVQLQGTGELVGAIFIHGSNFTPEAICHSDVTRPFGVPPEDCSMVLEAQFRNIPTLSFEVAVFGTRHNDESTSLILGLVLSNDTDVHEIADQLEHRMEEYHSFQFNRSFPRVLQSLNGRIVFNTGTEASALPVALVVMESPNPPPTPPEQEMVNALVIPWIRFLDPFDVLFLATE